MASSTFKPRKSCSFTTLLLSTLNFILFLLSAASFAPPILLKTPPTALGLALLAVSCLALLAAFVGFYSQLSHFCFLTHMALLGASLVGGVFGFVALFVKEEASLVMLRSPRDRREAMVLVRVECAVLAAMGAVGVAVAVVGCAVRRCWVREYEGLEERKRRRGARVEEEAMVVDDKMKSKFGED